MLERKKSGAMTPGIAADAPVQGGRDDQGVVPLAAPGAVTQYRRTFQPLALSVGLIIARLPLAYMPSCSWVSSAMLLEQCRYLLHAY
jgi:hypothetical protein